MLASSPPPNIFPIALQGILGHKGFSVYEVGAIGEGSVAGGLTKTKNICKQLYGNPLVS